MVSGVNRVLVVGVPRSGTTWLAATLATTPGAVLMHEPDNPAFSADAEESRALYGGYPVLRPGERVPEYEMLWDRGFGSAEASQLTAARQGRRLGRRAANRPAAVVAKSVFAAFAMEWLMDRYAPRVVLIERNPIAVVASWMRLDFVIGDLATRDRIRAEHVEPFDMPSWDPALPRSIQVSWAVGVLMSALRRQARDHPEWTVVSHEELSADRSQVRGLAASVGLDWSDQAEAAALGTDGAGGSAVLTDVDEVSGYLSRFPELAASLVSHWS
jgi:hypothetical protein